LHVTFEGNKVNHEIKHRMKGLATYSFQPISLVCSMKLRCLGVDDSVCSRSVEEKR